MEKFVFKAKSFKKMEDPNFGDRGRTKYICYVQANSIPREIDNWMGTNPREQKMTTNVASKIIDSLKTNSNFHELNRGIVLSVEKAKFDNESNELEIWMDDPSVHGNIDGGHTLRAILQLKNENMLLDDKYVSFEIFTGLSSPVELAAARNISVQVDLKSIEELQKSFETLKKVFRGIGFEERIAYKMNEHYTEEEIIPIDVRETIAILMMFNQTVYPKENEYGILNESQPIQCYTGKETTLKRFLSYKKEVRDEMVEKMKPIISDIFKLYEKIECNFGQVANSSGKRYGTRKYSKFDYNKVVDRSQFYGSDLIYVVPKGIIYPLLASFRALVFIDDKGDYCWRKDPVTVWDKLGGKLTTMILDEKTENPDALGKNNNLWSNLFKEVYIYAFLTTSE